MPRHEDVCTEFFDIFGRTQQISWYGTVLQEVRAPRMRDPASSVVFGTLLSTVRNEFESQNYSLPLFISTIL